MKITTAEEMREIDRVTSERHGVPSLTLMENAGTHVADYVLRRYPPAQRIAVVCGKGNNGGDGFVAARKLHEAGKKVDILLLGDPEEVKGDAAAMLAKLPLAPLVIRSEEELRAGVVPALALNECDLILEAILGTGFKPPVTGLFAAAIEMINAFPVPVFAVDIPSGASADAFAPEPHLRCRADAIVTFTAPRPAHVYADLTRGEIVVGQIGSPPEAIQSQLNLDVIAWPDIQSCFAPRAPIATFDPLAASKAAGIFRKDGQTTISSRVCPARSQPRKLVRCRRELPGPKKLGWAIASLPACLSGFPPREDRN